MDHQVSGRMTAKIITFDPSAALTNDYSRTLSTLTASEELESIHVAGTF